VCLPRDTTVIEAILAIELDHEALLKVAGRLAHNLDITVPRQVIASNCHLAITRLSAHSRLGMEVNEFAAEIPLVLLRDVHVECTG
jgi:hypothetical protein